MLRACIFKLLALVYSLNAVADIGQLGRAHKKVAQAIDCQELISKENIQKFLNYRISGNFLLPNQSSIESDPKLAAKVEQLVQSPASSQRYSLLADKVSKELGHISPAILYQILSHSTFKGVVIKADEFTWPEVGSFMVEESSAHHASGNRVHYAESRLNNNEKLKQNYPSRIIHEFGHILFSIFFEMEIIETDDFPAKGNLAHAIAETYRWNLYDLQKDPDPRKRRMFEAINKKYGKIALAPTDGLSHQFLNEYATTAFMVNPDDLASISYFRDPSDTIYDKNWITPMNEYFAEIFAAYFTPNHRQILQAKDPMAYKLMQTIESIFMEAILNCNDAQTDEVSCI